MRSTCTWSRRTRSSPRRSRHPSCRPDAAPRGPHTTGGHTRAAGRELKGVQGSGREALCAVSCIFRSRSSRFAGVKCPTKDNRGRARNIEDEESKVETKEQQVEKNKYIAAVSCLATIHIHIRLWAVNTVRLASCEILMSKYGLSTCVYGVLMLTTYLFRQSLHYMHTRCLVPRLVFKNWIDLHTPHSCKSCCLYWLYQADRLPQLPTRLGSDAALWMECILTCLSTPLNSPMLTNASSPPLHLS